MHWGESGRWEQGVGSDWGRSGPVMGWEWQWVSSPILPLFVCLTVSYLLVMTEKVNDHWIMRCVKKCFPSTKEHISPPPGIASLYCMLLAEFTFCHFNFNLMCAPFPDHILDWLTEQNISALLSPYVFIFLIYSPSPQSLFCLSAYGTRRNIFLLFTGSCYASLRAIDLRSLI